jgi:hypothetical protein
MISKTYIFLRIKDFKILDTVEWSNKKGKKIITHNQKKDIEFIKELKN